MIKLSRLDGEQFVLNADLIRYVESRPDTFITLTSGERLVVAETMDEVFDRTVQYQQTKHLMPAPATHAPRQSASSASLAKPTAV
ncbi:MAG: flagellar FlbD family protein [Planctomycetes bacterium]|nr:flagellar FlbD family protein [Planctomycetota bacterium]